MRSERHADPVYKARLVVLLQVPRTRDELIRLAKLPSVYAYDRVIKTIKTITVGSKNVKIQLDDGKRADLDK